MISLRQTALERSQISDRRQPRVGENLSATPNMCEHFVGLWVTESLFLGGSGVWGGPHAHTLKVAVNGFYSARIASNSLSMLLKALKSRLNANALNGS